MNREKVKAILDKCNKLRGGKDFDVRLICSNCAHSSTFWFPFGTDLRKKPWGEGTKARIPTDKVPFWKQETVTCPRCGSDRIG